LIKERGGSSLIPERRLKKKPKNVTSAVESVDMGTMSTLVAEPLKQRQERRKRTS